MRTSCILIEKLCKATGTDNRKNYCSAERSQNSCVIRKEQNSGMLGRIDRIHAPAKQSSLYPLHDGTTTKMGSLTREL